MISLISTIRAKRALPNLRKARTEAHARLIDAKRRNDTRGQHAALESVKRATVALMRAEQAAGVR